LSFYDSKQSSELNRLNEIDSPSTSLNQSPKTPNKKFKKMSSLVDVERDDQNWKKLIYVLIFLCTLIVHKYHKNFIWFFIRLILR